MFPQAFALEDGQHTFAEPISLFEVGIPGQDEVSDAESGVLDDALCDLGMRSDEGGSRASADKSDTRPQVRRNLEPVQSAPVQLDHAALAL